MRASAVLIKLHPLAIWSDEQWIVDAADVSVFPLDRCRILWLAKDPVMPFSVCLAAGFSLNSITCNIIACYVVHYLIPFSGLISSFLIVSCRSICQS